jgi:rhodanese-related sulfurtransferase/glyoxylase-like metal-dependent hydrolase (beta-lactamase superfamily II)
MSTGKVVILAVAAILMPIVAFAAEIQDAESATHGFEAAQYQAVDTYPYSGFDVIQYDLATLSHFSYLLVSDKEAMVVDPGRDVATYLEAAQDRGVKITAVWLTHSHADFVAGQIELAHALNVPIYISRRANAEYKHVPLDDGDTVQIGRAIVTFLETPGHTPDSMCGLVANVADPTKPISMFTGDTLFVGSVGRPDLLGEGMSASSLASMMFDTWTRKLSKLPDDVVIMPAHGAGSLCGAHLSDEPISTIGEQRISNSYLQYKTRGEFVAAVLEGLPEAPPYFAHNAAMNRRGPQLVEWNPAELPSATPSTELSDPQQYFVIDVRDAADYAAGHVPNSVNIGLRGRFETWTGIMVPWQSKVVVVGRAEQLHEAIQRLHRVGYQAHVLAFDAWEQAGLPVVKTPPVSPQQLYAAMQREESPLVVDVRLHKEWEELRIGTVVNMPLNHLQEQSVKLDRGQPVVVVCNSAYRSSLAVGVLERRGFSKVRSLAGGGEAWIEAGLPVVEQGVACAVPSASGEARASVRLADRISASELKRTMMDLPGTVEVVDIRPAAHFADYNLPGSQNVDIAQVLSNPAYLSGNASLVIVDRDGSLAMMVAGILSQKTDRRIIALHGGLQAYWAESDLGSLIAPGPLPGSSGAAARSLPASPTKSAAAPATRPKKRRSAGC